MAKFIVSTQVREWYGSENHVGDLAHGRYKAKGGAEFIVDLDATFAMYRADDFREAFEREHNAEGQYFRYEFLAMEPWYEPTLLKFYEDSLSFAAL